MHGVYRYALPKDWVKATSNSYVSPDETHRILEQIYPKAKITLEYCQSFVVMGDAQPGDRSARLHDNGAFIGCFRTRDYHNSKLGTTWRHASFSFPGPHGVEDLTIVTRLDRYDEAEVIRIFDSIRAKRPRSPARRR